MITFKSELVLITEGLTKDYNTDPKVRKRIDFLEEQAKALGISLTLSYTNIKYYRLGDYVYFDLVVEGDKLIVRYFIKHIVDYFRCTDDWNEKVCEGNVDDRFYIENN